MLLYEAQATIFSSSVGKTFSAVTQRYVQWRLVVKLAGRAAKFHLWLQACRQDLAAGGPKTRWRGKKQMGATFFKYSIGYMQQPGGQTWKGGNRFQMGGPGATGPPLATTLSGWTYGIVALAAFMVSGVSSHSSSPNLIKLVIFNCSYWYTENIHFMKPNPKA